MNLTGLSIRLPNSGEEYGIRLTYRLKPTEKKPDLPTLKKAAREALQNALKTLDEGKVDRGGFSEGPRMRWDELLVEVKS